VDFVGTTGIGVGGFSQDTELGVWAQGGGSWEGRVRRRSLDLSRGKMRIEDLSRAPAAYRERIKAAKTCKTRKAGRRNPVAGCSRSDSKNAPATQDLQVGKRNRLGRGGRVGSMAGVSTKKSCVARRAETDHAWWEMTQKTTRRRRGEKKKGGFHQRFAVPAWEGRKQKAP